MTKTNQKINCNIRLACQGLRLSSEKGALFTDPGSWRSGTLTPAQSLSSLIQNNFC